MDKHITNISEDYAKFLDSKSQGGLMGGFEPLWFPKQIFPFQKYLTSWMIRKGKASGFADTGLGKTLMQATWCENVVRHTNKPTLLVTMLGVTAQTQKQCEQFGIDCERSKTGQWTAKRVVITNYESLPKFNPDDFGGCACDESGGLADFDSKRTAMVNEFVRRMTFRSLWSATPAPNDYDELGNSSEILGELGYQDMLTRFFKKNNKGGGTGWARVSQKLKGHSERGFWQWVCSWARFVRKPSDLGDFDDSPYKLPKLIQNEHVVKAPCPRKGLLFDVPAFTLREQAEEQRITITERCEKVAELVSKKPQSLVWCHLNPEGDLLAKLIPDSVQISGSDTDEEKEEAFEAFASGQLKRLITKYRIASRGLNFQRCSHATCFPSNSFQDYYQGVRRLWRFGQTQNVEIEIVNTEGSLRVRDNLDRKEKQHEQMFANCVQYMNEALKIGRTEYGNKPTEAPAWLRSVSTN